MGHSWQLHTEIHSSLGLSSEKVHIESVVPYVVLQCEHLEMQSVPVLVAKPTILWPNHLH